MTDKMGVQDMM